ncbi:uncharacterized protein TNCT_602921 [Trichonephila clavata]|uniref:Uncharacterized protein n=1 Tax=Trichonephila clavata TaxID=2740835 RepID=A0A8X6K1L1_TRICU|nr:uncharacterized protein TNCT_602921 [Trichonephila clavata]
MYDNLEQFLKSFEEIMSFPIFLIVSSDLMGLVYGLIKLDPFNNIPEEKINDSFYWWAIVFVSVRGFISFLCISMAASRIHDASRNSKDTKEDILKRIHTYGEKKEIQESLLLNTSFNNLPFVLSAWKVFYFKRGVILSVTGSIMTYTLLIMQILK